MPDPLERDIAGYIAKAVEDTVARGHVIGPSLFGVIECYDGDHTLHFEQRPSCKSICPLGAAAIATPNLEKADNSKARKAERLEPAIACMLRVPVDYVFGYAMGFDGHKLWPGIEYGPEYARGFRDGAAMRTTLLPGAPAPA
jgi:hypothetical protein